MHTWSEENFDWKGLNKAICYIEKRFRFWRIPVRQAKEKFGTARIYCSLGWYSLHDITHPGYAYYCYPKWLIRADIFYLSKIIQLLNYVVLPLHKYIYKAVYKRAVEMFPHLKEEICCMADYVDLLDFYDNHWEKVEEVK